MYCWSRNAAASPGLAAEAQGVRWPSDFVVGWNMLSRTFIVHSLAVALVTLPLQAQGFREDIRISGGAVRLFHKTGWTVGGVLIWPLGSNGRHWLGAEGAIASSGVAYPAGGNRRSTESGGIRYERRFAPRSTTSLYVGAHALVVHSSNSDNPFISPGDFGSPVPRPNNEDFAGISGVGGGAGVLAGARMRVSTGCTLLTGISLDYLRVYSGQSTSTAWAWTVGMTFGQ